MNKVRKKLLPIGYLWEKFKPDYTSYLTGPFGDNSVLYIFKNKSKSEEDDHDFVCYIGENEEGYDYAV